MATNRDWMLAGLALLGGGFALYAGAEMQRRAVERARRLQIRCPQCGTLLLEEVARCPTCDAALEWVDEPEDEPRRAAAGA